MRMGRSPGFLFLNTWCPGAKQNQLPLPVCETIDVANSPPLLPCSSPSVSSFSPFLHLNPTFSSSSPSSCSQFSYQLIFFSSLLVYLLNHSSTRILIILSFLASSMSSLPSLSFPQPPSFLTHFPPSLPVYLTL